jgi:hypothetical protein
MLKRFIPLALAGPLIAGAALVAPLGGTVSAACSIGRYQSEQARGQDSEQVRCLQQALHDHGIDSGPVDGWFGPVTRGAVVAYQQASGLTVDGQVGQETAGSLGIWSPSSSNTTDDDNNDSDTRQQQSAPARSSSNSGGGTVWDRLAQCESGGNWSINTGNGYYGGLQFLPSSWRAAGGSGMPHQASREEQIRVAENLRSQVGSFRPWPQCAAKLGLL